MRLTKRRAEKNSNKIVADTYAKCLNLLATAPVPHFVLSSSFSPRSASQNYLQLSFINFAEDIRNIRRNS